MLRSFSTRVITSWAPQYSTSLRTAPALGLLRGYATKKYTKDHEWISIENEVGTIGITEYAQNALGDVVFVEVPEVGKEFDREEQIGAIESVKAASDIYAPVSGEVLEVNTVLESEPSLVNKSPEKDGWLAKVKITKPEELDELLDESAYRQFCEK
ncbi:uncharacterized protein VTP21DRAFT_8883 [Calcarisporiella thermophila]|uniref:uncharacterized protein n=1 Tax=Calcarisporiella thermophila TaxID=911321 RepID=UPI003743D004